MAAPKLSNEEWAKARRHWEGDPRDGFTWLVNELSLPVSPNGAKKKAGQGGWRKDNDPAAKSVAAKTTRVVLVQQDGSEPKSEPSELAANQAKEEAKPFKTRETPVLDELDKREPRQGLFVREYVKDLNGTQAAIRAGYSVQTAGSQAHDLLKKPEIQAAIRELREETLRGLEAKVEELVRHWLDILRADPNAITAFKRDCCPYCHGTVAEDGYRRAKQMTPAQYDHELLKHQEKRAKVLDQSGQIIDIGEFPSHEGDWFDRRRAINPDCPECQGRGVGEMFVADTRRLAPGVAALFNGVKKTKDGIEILMASKERAADQLGRLLGAFRDKEGGVTVNVMAPEALTELFWTRMSAARDRQRRINEERGNIIDVPSDTAAQ